MGALGQSGPTLERKLLFEEPRSRNHSNGQLRFFVSLGDSGSPGDVTYETGTVTARRFLRRVPDAKIRRVMRSLILAAAALTLTGCDANRIARLEKQNQELLLKLDTMQKASAMELQAKCANQAKAAYDESGLAKQGMGGYINHYSARVDKCYVLFTSMDAKDKKPSVYKSVMDAFEGKTYAEYFWKNSDGRNYSGVKPFVCYVTLASGDEKVCRSDKEFEDLIKPYMEQ